MKASPIPIQDHRTMNGDDLDALWSSKRVRSFLDVPERTLRRWISSGKFPKPDVRIGFRGRRQTLRWKRSTIDAWVEKGGAT